MQNIVDSTTSCSPFNDYLQTTGQLKSLKVQVSGISEAIITTAPEEWIRCLTATKKATREAL